MVYHKDLMPNFLIIGAARSGTSSLYEYLRHHPEIYFSKNKEPMFFALEGQKVDFKGPGDDKQINLKSVTDLETYKSLFKNVTTEKVIGEASTLYLYSEKAPNCIHHYIPQAKLVAILRNPVERAYSSFLYNIRDGRETLNDFSDALRAEEVRIADNWEHIWHYRNMGYYYKQLKRYYDLFRDNQIKIYLYDEMQLDIKSLLKDIYTFLEVNSSFDSNTSIVYNKGGVPNNKILNKILTHQSNIKRIIKPHVPEYLMQLYTHYKHKNLQRPDLKEEIREELINCYGQDILRLQDLIQKDLASWLQ